MAREIESAEYAAGFGPQPHGRRDAARAPASLPLPRRTLRGLCCTDARLLDTTAAAAVPLSGGRARAVRSVVRLIEQFLKENRLMRTLAALQVPAAGISGTFPVCPVANSMVN